MALDEQVVSERFHSVLVREFASRPPWDLNAPLTVADIYHNLVPFEIRREELGLRSFSDYERTLLRLLTGEGGYLRLESEADLKKLRGYLGTSDGARGVYSELLRAPVQVNLKLSEGPISEKGLGDLPHFEDCPACSEALPQQSGVKFCPSCGSDVQRVPCQPCGELLRLHWLFCTACGAEVEQKRGQVLRH